MHLVFPVRTQAEGQQGLHEQSGSGGTFVVRTSDEKYIPLVIAGGAGGCRDISAEQIIFANGQINKYGGKSGSIKEMNTNEGRSGEGSNYEPYYMGAAGFYMVLLKNTKIYLVLKNYLRSRNKSLFIFKSVKRKIYIFNKKIVYSRKIFNFS